MNSFSALCTIRLKDGKPSLKLYDLMDFTDGLKQFGEGEELQLTIEPAGRKRTGAQNRFFHGPILNAFKSLGLYKQEAKDMLCLKFLPKECRQLDGSTVIVPGHTSDLKVEEFNEFIDQCMQLAAENDLYIQDGAEWRAKHRTAA